MPISEGDVAAELAEVRDIVADAKTIETFLIAVLRALTDGDPLWAQIDPTSGQKSTLLTFYDGQKSAFKTKVSNY